ncbi:hypothetical protein Dcae01_03169 [Deinococcus caeni]|uniref:Uncharacterized protein n=1 Tax=Deinococcus caeni TaxID=569127 RepID=A0ABP9ULG5_9DEIO
MGRQGGQLRLRGGVVATLRQGRPVPLGPLYRLEGRFTPQNAAALKERTFDRAALGRRGLGLEHLDQLTNDLLFGVR